MGRRRTVLAAIAVSLGVAVSPAHAADPPSSSWAQTGYNAAGSHANLAEHTISRGNVSTLTTRLTVAGTQDDGHCSAGVSATAVSETRFYVVNCGVLSARSLADGTVLWQHRLPDSEETRHRQLLVEDGLVIVVGEVGVATTDVGGSIDVLDESSGRPRYSQSQLGLANVEVSGEYLVLHSLTSPQQAPFTKVERVTDGSVAWHTPYGGANYCSTESWTIGGHVFMSLCDRLRALDVATGDFAWRRRGNYTVQAGDSDTPDAQHLWVHDNTDNRLVDLDPATGRIRTVLDGPATTVLAVTATRVFAGDRTDVFAYDAATGAQLWRSHRPARYAAAWANGLLFLDTGTVLAANSGKVRAVIPLSYDSVLSGVRAVGSGNVAVITGSPSRLDLLAPA